MRVWRGRVRWRGFEAVTRPLRIFNQEMKWNGLVSRGDRLGFDPETHALDYA